jgi:acyl-CoA synthetase (AMP-forming)/AMP-acid ligase II|tara:strand:+ start:209 stop:1645 length:1437 start_codon:yes stop_codon:yes gene_type:complete
MNTIIDFFKNSVKNYPDKIAVIFEKNEISYKQLDNLVNSLSNSLIHLEKASIVSIYLENSTDFVVSYLAILNAGMIAHLIPTNLRKEKIQKQLEISQSKLIITSKHLIDKINSINYNCKKIIFIESNFHQIQQNKLMKINNEHAYLIFTSGTTAEPKGVIITQSNTIFTTKNIIDVLKYDEFDVNVLPLPLTHSFGLGCLHASLFVGSTLILIKNATNTVNILKEIQQYNATTFAAVPLTLNKILKEHDDCSSYFKNLRLIITNSTSIPVKTVEKYRDILKNGFLATYYGLTEASRSTFMIFDKLGRETSVGKPYNDVMIKIQNESLNELETGQILIKGDNVIKNYWNNLEADKRIVDYWLQTGDLGHKDSEGYLYLDGRIDYVINVAGEKIIPDDIETVVKVLTDVEDVVAIGIKNEMYGEIIKLFVKKSVNSKITKFEILSQCIKNLESHKVPREIEFMDDFPKNEFGKIQRFKLK